MPRLLRIRKKVVMKTSRGADIRLKSVSIQLTEDLINSLTTMTVRRVELFWHHTIHAAMVLNRKTTAF